MLDTVRVAATAIDSRPGQTGSNLDTIESWCSQAAAERANLVLFPELSITGFVPNHPVGDHDRWLREALLGARKMAERIPGPAVTRLEGIAKAADIYIAAGLLEDAGNTLHNTHVLVGPEGLVGKWRKMHVPMFEMPFYNGGQAPDVVETPLGRIGVNICFDALIPESTRLLALQNVEIVLFPFAADPPPCTPEGWADWAGPAVKARCVENGVFGIACNYTGEVTFAGVDQRFPGGGFVVDPRGQVQARWGGAAAKTYMLLTELRREVLITARSEPEYLFRFRRPELYGALAK